jgi:hypothetical protein
VVGIISYLKYVMSLIDMDINSSIIQKNIPKKKKGREREIKKEKEKVLWGIYVASLMEKLFSWEMNSY